MNKNGFIATSLIYSFFLIFVTLFLAIIADYLQNKVLLNTIENGIKDELNTEFGVIDFEVGDMVSFVKDCEDETIASSTNQWVVAKVDYKKDDEKVVFYSYDFDSAPFTTGITELEYTDLENDIDIGYRNGTYLNKILYTFNVNPDISGIPQNKDYSLGSVTDSEGNEVSKKASIECTSAEGNIFDTGSNCILDDAATNNKKRYRYQKEIGNGKIDKCQIKNSSVIYLVK